MSLTKYQFVITLVMFLVSRKFHPSFGVAGTEFEGDYFAHKAAQGRGWEWYVLITFNPTLISVLT